MNPSKKHESVETTIADTFGFDRRDNIKRDRCVPPPIGCGKTATEFRDDSSRREFGISGLCQKCQDRIFDAEEGEEEPYVTPPAPPRPARYIAKPDEFITEDYAMFSGQGEAVSHRYHKHIGKSGNTWLVADGEAAGENVYVTNTPANTGGKGFGGATLRMPLVDGSTFELRGGWHSNSDALYADTGVDVRNQYRTFVVLAMEQDSTQDGTYRTILRGIVYKDDAPVLGSFDRYKDLVRQYPQAKFVYSQSKGGSSCGSTDHYHKAAA